MIARRFIGIAARDLAKTHLKAISFAMFVLLTVAIAIDLTKNLDDVRTKALEESLGFVPLLLEYLLYRSADIIARLLPMACLIGGFIAELLRHQRMEPVILSAAGAPPTLLFAALFGVGLAVGSLQAALEGWWRPAAVFAQADLELGTYGGRFRQGNIGTYWMIEGDRAIEARVIRKANPELQDFRLFDGIRKPALDRIIEARVAVPTEIPQVWRLRDAVVWQETDTGTPLRPKQHEQLDLELSFTASHIRYHNIFAFYLPNGPLRDIAAIKGTERTADAETAVVRRFAALFLPGIFAFLGATLAQCGRNGRFFAWWRLMALGTLGYINVVSVKAFWSLGEFGVLPPLASATLPMLFALILASIMQLWLNGFPERNTS